MADSRSTRRSISQSDYTRDPNQMDMKVVMVLSVAGILFCAGFFLLVHYDLVQLYPSGWTHEMLKGFALKAEFSIRYQTLLMFWLLFNIFVTMFARTKTQALNPLDGDTEQRVQIFKNILTNSYESILLSSISQLIFTSYADSATVLRYIPLVNILMFIGRVTFFAGYPLKRGFGMICTLIPNSILCYYNMYKFGQFVGFY